MKKYTYLFTDPSGSRLAADTLESNTLLTETSLIIRDEMEKKFIHFDNPKQYQSVYKDTHLTHEIILSWQKQKPKFDLDGGTESDHQSIIEANHSHSGYNTIHKYNPNRK
jgi:hypothetical protein